MKSRIWWFGMLAAVMAWSCGPGGTGTTEEAEVATGPGGPASADPTALAVADSVVEACGGWEAANQARYVAFTFVVEKDGKELQRRRHQLDRHTGDCRIQGVSREGIEFDIIMDAATRDGEVMMDGEPANTESKQQMLDMAYGAFINDAYWLFMPFKLHDPGVHLADEGVRTDDEGKDWRVLKLHFDSGVGLTPGDQYWVYVDPATYRPGRWDYHLQNMAAEDPPSVASWIGWQQLGPVWLSLEKQMTPSGVVIRFEDVQVMETPPEGIFG
jgi:hypothetical protein